MELTALVKVNGVTEREFKGKRYQSVNLYIDGHDADSVKVGIPETAIGLDKIAREQVDKRCKAVLNLRTFKGSMFLDLVSLEPLTVAGPSAAPVKH